MGFPSNQALEEVDEDLSCAVCLDIYTKPVIVCNQGHSCCNECATKVSGTCPHCRSPMLSTPTPNIVIQKIVGKIKRRLRVVAKTTGAMLRSGRGAQPSKRLKCLRRRHRRGTFASVVAFAMLLLLVVVLLLVTTQLLAMRLFERPHSMSSAAASTTAQLGGAGSGKDGASAGAAKASGGGFVMEASEGSEALGPKAVEVFGVGLKTSFGTIRISVREEATPLASAFLSSLAGKGKLEGGGGAEASGGGEGGRDDREVATGRFYRAEPVPEWWGSPSLPDSTDGGRWGPPYALLQGSLAQHSAGGRGAGRGVPAFPAPPPAETGAAGRPLMERGDVAWAGGGGGPEFFVALAAHPEWGHGHTVWGRVMRGDGESWAVIRRLMSARTRTQQQGIAVSLLQEPVEFAVVAL